MRAAFVDLGLGRDGYLWADDAGDAETAPAIDRLPRRGQDLIVQVTKDGLAGKGVRITSQVTLPGRYLVLTPTGDRVGISRRIEDTDERDRLRQLVLARRAESVALPGCIVRTAAAGVAGEQIQEEYAELAATWRRIEERSAAVAAPALVQREDELDVRVIRDLFSADFDSLLVTAPTHTGASRTTWEGCSRSSSSGSSGTRRGLFDRYRIDEAVEAALRSRAPLPSGGYLVINQTEALVAIDVNTGSDRSAPRTSTRRFLRTNLEAVAEAVRQIPAARSVRHPGHRPDRHGTRRPPRTGVRPPGGGTREGPRQAQGGLKSRNSDWSN